MRVLLTSNKNRDVASNATNLALSFFKLEGKEKKNPLVLFAICSCDLTKLKRLTDL